MPVDCPPRQMTGALTISTDGGPYSRVMNCPHDQTVLQMTERQGIEIDYCPTCRGVWLDRGELDKIIERVSAPAAPTTSRSQPQPEPRWLATRLDLHKPRYIRSIRPTGAHLGAPTALMTTTAVVMTLATSSREGGSHSSATCLTSSGCLAAARELDAGA
jgi:Zn-finger nucleic acid-binding protein